MMPVRWTFLFSSMFLSRWARASFLRHCSVKTTRLLKKRICLFPERSNPLRPIARLMLLSDQTLAPSRTTTRTGGTSTLRAAKLSISDSFDGGNIEFVGATSTTSTTEGNMENDGQPTVTPTEITARLRIKPDVYTELEETRHSQYFAFKSMLNTDTPVTVKYVIENASQVSYPRAWTGSTVFFSRNLADWDSWRRALDTSYSLESGELSWTYEHTRTSGPVYFCCFPPFTYSQHLELVSKCAPYARGVESLGQTLEGRDMDCISVGSGDLVCWIIHRQHPGEPMASYFAHGLLNRLLGFETAGEVDGKVRDALKSFQFFIVPLMCPDGAVRGHLRTNGVGSNLNREWANSPDYDAPSLRRSPEVYSVLERMKETGVDVFVDVHGDEELPFNFLSGSEGSLNWGPRLESLHGAFVAAYIRANSDMQAAVGYNKPPPGRRGSPNLATNAIADRFDCLAVTLEMPFKDCLSNPDPERGWSPNRASMLGSSLIDALMRVQPYLRVEGEFWKQFPDEDAYVRTSSKYSGV